MDKESIYKNLRAGIIGLLASIGLILNVSEPAEQEAWFRVFFISKVAGLGLWWICYKLTNYWEQNGLLPEDLLKDDDGWE